ncbi:hypothetical protein [Deinococcus ruber]|uniref:Uncharacterized protein n=1 Tax=Deinococcus ruber TaxID=1848197 RepID=A0A918CMG9_9DEIO|nr:hypothetical protein [Deinococcus ruber]GGR31360.1 hypothetical protein GCM10008957_47570 [Deinococcus ruber]
MSADVEQEGHIHCWHGTGVVLESFPPQFPEICCLCGEKRTRRGSTPNPSMHGPFLPKTGSHFGRVIGEAAPALKPFIDAMEQDQQEFEQRSAKKRAKFEREYEDAKERHRKFKERMGH